MRDALLASEDELQDAKNDQCPYEGAYEAGICTVASLLTNAFSCLFLFSIVLWTSLRCLSNAYSFVVTQHIRVGKCKRVNSN